MIEREITPAALKALIDGDIHNFLVASTPGGIEAQEAQGQKELEKNVWIPKEMLYGCTKEKLESLGIIFEKDIDDLFWETKLPEGWKIEPTEHSMYSLLIDRRGRNRAEIFYKAAFYDKSANIFLLNRFRLERFTLCDCDGNEIESKKATHLKIVVKDQEKEIFVAGIRPQHLSSYFLDSSLAIKHERIALEWLEENYSDWDNAMAYWE